MCADEKRFRLMASKAAAPGLFDCRSMRRRRSCSRLLKKSHTEVTHHLARQELDALIDAPDQRTRRGRRDRTLLLFLARTGARVSEALGVDACATHIVRRAVATATANTPELARKSISPHVLRHTLAMTLLQSGVDSLTIQAWLGHSQVATTHRYAAADVEMMRRGLHKAGVAGNQPARFQPKDAVLQLLESI